MHVVPVASCWGVERTLVGFYRAVWYQESDLMASGWCARMNQILLSRDVGEVINDLVQHDCLTLSMAIMDIFQSQSLYHEGNAACSGRVLLCSFRGEGLGVQTSHLENHKAVGFLRNTGICPWKITNLPNQHSVSCQHWPTVFTLYWVLVFLEKLVQTPILLCKISWWLNKIKTLDLDPPPSSEKYFWIANDLSEQLLSKKEGKYQELIQSSTTPDPGYHWESDNVTTRHHNREPEISSFPTGDHKASTNRRAWKHSKTKQK